MYQFIKKIAKWILPYNIFIFLSTLKNLRNSKNRRWHPITKGHTECVLIANGPSTSLLIKKISTYNADFVTVNWSLEVDAIREIHPKNHICIDPIFFNNGFDRFIHMLNKVNFSMNLYVSADIQDITRLKNNIPDNITIYTVPLLLPPRDISEGYRFKLCDSGKFGCGGMNVTVAALYTMINAGYKKIYISGMDLSYKQEQYSDKNCITYLKNYSHFYGKSYTQTLNTPIATFYWCEFRFHIEMEFVKKYAEYKNCICINLSETSLIDTFDKGTLDGVIYKNMRKNPDCDYYNLIFMI